MAVSDSAGTTETKYYAGGLYELSVRGSETIHTCYIFAGGKAIAILRSSNTNGVAIRYLHHDHLGSIQAYSDENGLLVQQLSYDAWGRRRDPATWDYYDSMTDARAWQERGFCGHEHLDLFEMVNMDGRMYDPIMGRFLSPDPYMQAPDLTQGLNRYSYCLNNPLSLTDPSGYSWLSDNWRSLVGAAVGIAVGALTAGTGATVGVAILAGAAGGAAGALTGALLNGANIGQVAKATFTGAFWGAVGGSLNFISADEELLAKLFKHTFTQGFLEGVQGGNVYHGFMMGAVSSAGGHFIDKYANSMGKLGEITANAVLSGTVDEIGGGKFANGAVTGAFAIMFNDMMHILGNQDEIQKSQFEFSGPVEKPLEPVYPEFAIILAGRTLFNGILGSILVSNEQYSSIQDLISRMTYRGKLKRGIIQGSIKSHNMKKVFRNLASKHKVRINYDKNGNAYFYANGYRVSMHNSTKGAGQTLDINYNRGLQIYKIRLDKDL
jgi:RHS repeat-associated protein